MRVPLTLLASLAFVAAAASTASAAVGSLETYKVEIDVSLSVSERSIWNGIYPGCFAPQEKFDQTYKLEIDSKPGRKSKIKAGTATLFPGTFGTTNSYGARSSFRQSAKSGPWELQVANPAGCNSAAAPVPSWATSPTCKKISERVSATLSGSSDAGSSDGWLVIRRGPKASPASRGGSIGASCYRTLHNVDFPGVNQVFEVGLKDSFIQVPVPNLRQKLEKLTNGSSSSRPSFKIPIKLSGDCNNAKMSPQTDLKDSWSPLFGSLPHQALGYIGSEYNRSVCMVSGSGSATVRRVAAVKSTVVPLR